MKYKPLSDDEIKDQQAAITEWKHKKKSRWLKRQNFIYRLKNLKGVKK